MRMVDLFCGLGGATKGFMAEGWECIGYDLNPQPKYPATFVQRDILTMTEHDLAQADFIWASSPCEQFSVHCMKHFHPNPKWPEMGIKLFEHTRNICEASGKPYVMENVRCAEKFVGRAVNHCGPFYLWGNAVPAVMPRGVYSVTKGFLRKDSHAYRAANYGEKRRSQLIGLKRHWPQGVSDASAAAEIPLIISQYIAQQAANLIGAIA